VVHDSVWVRANDVPNGNPRHTVERHEVSLGDGSAADPPALVQADPVGRADGQAQAAASG
jgi:hypothetical protein